MKEIDNFRKQRNPKQDRPREDNKRHNKIKMPKVKDNERILKAAREKQLVTGEFPKDCQLICQKKLCRLQEIGKKYSKWWKARTYNLDYTTQQNYHLDSEGR